MHALVYSIEPLATRSTEDVCKCAGVWVCSVAKAAAKKVPGRRMPGAGFPSRVCVVWRVVFELVLHRVGW